MNRSTPSHLPSPPLGERVVPQSRDRVRGRFMVPVRDPNVVEAFREPTHPWPFPAAVAPKRRFGAPRRRGAELLVWARRPAPLLGGVGGGFMVPMRGRYTVEAAHETGSRGRESAHSEAQSSQRRLTSAATVRGLNARTFASGHSLLGRGGEGADIAGLACGRFALLQPAPQAVSSKRFHTLPKF